MRHIIEAIGGLIEYFSSDILGAFFDHLGWTQAIAHIFGIIVLAFISYLLIKFVADAVGLK